MTRRRTKTALIAASAATALLLTACGGSDNGDAGDDIPGVDNSAAPTDEPEDEPEEEEEPADDERPEVDYGGDFEQIHESVDTTDPELDEVILDIQGFQDAVAEGIATHDNDRPALRYYTAGAARTATLALLDNVIEQGISSIGTARYFHYSATLLDNEAATFSFCRDFSEVATIDFETKEVIEEADAEANPTLYAGRAEQNEDGVWQTVEYDLNRDAQECQ